jgi:hypothetical protein
LSSGHLLSRSSAAYEEESSRRRPSPSSTRVEKGPYGQQANAEEEEASESFHSARANLLDLSDGMMADTSKAELSFCDESPGVLRRPAIRTVPTQLRPNGFGLPGDENGADCSSNSFASFHEQRKPRYSVSFAETGKAADSRRKSGEIEAAGVSSSSFECKDAHPRVSFLQGEDQMALDASHGESFTASESPNLVKSASSDLEVRPKVVVFDLGTSQRKDQHECVIKTVMFSPISKLSTAFSFWKARYRRHQSFGILGERDIVPKFRPIVRHIAGRADRLKELAERYELFSEIDTQHEINAKLKERLRQMEREHVSTQRSLAASNRLERIGDNWSPMSDTVAQRPHLGTRFRARFT